MRIVTFFFVLLVSFSLIAAPKQESIKHTIDELKAINAQLLNNQNASIDKLLNKKTAVLEQLMKQLKTKKNIRFMTGETKGNKSFLQSRISINSERGHQLAVLRDKIKLETYKVDQSIANYLKYLVESSSNYTKIETIVEKSQKELEQISKDEKKLALPKVELETDLFFEVKKNYQLFLTTSNSYRDILNYVVNNPREIASVHWFQEFSLLSGISYINHFDSVHAINNKLAPFKVDVGGIFFSILIIFLVIFSYPYIFKCTCWCVENYIIDKDVEQQEMIYHEIRRPARSLLIFWGINLGADAFFYKTDFRSVIESGAFVIYSLIFIWLISKIIDSIVLIQIQKISSRNKELRKELFNLAVQMGKGFVVVVILAFDLNYFGISLTAIMSTLGVGGLAFALAAKDTLSNLFGGVTILFDNVFRMGDWIKVGDAEGSVAEIGLRSTTVRTFDNALITIPNSIISVSSVMNWNRRAVGRRIKMHVGVTYESNMDDIRQTLDDIRDMLKHHPGIANPQQKITNNKRRDFKFTSQADAHGIKTTQLVFMDRYSDFSIDILIYCFTRTVNWSEWLSVKEDVLFKIADILKKNNLEFAYPTEVIIHKPESKNGMNIHKNIEPF
ncbi:MAG: mechanosensitive ion channel family protein [Methylococcales bacterium]